MMKPMTTSAIVYGNFMYFVIRETMLLTIRR